MTATIIRDLSFADYLSAPGVNFSTLKHLDASPLHYRRAIDAESRADTAAMRLGRLAHALVLSPHLPGDVVLWDGKVRRGKTWDAFQVENADRLIVREEELAKARAMCTAVHTHPIARRLLADGAGEVSITWEPADGPWRSRCKARLDWVTRGRGLVELKTTKSIHPRAFAAEFARRMYHAQAAFYSSALSIAVGADRSPDELLPIVIAVENVPPHDVCVYRIGYDTLEAGQRKIDEWLFTLRRCINSGTWPSTGGDDVLDMKLPDWALTDGLADVELEGIEDV